MIPLFKVAMSPNAAIDASRVLNSGYVGQGDRVEDFENALKGFLMTPHLVTTNSATSGLHLALHMLGLPMGTRVLTTPLTCTATNWAIKANRLVPDWVDIDPRTLNICLQDVRAKLGKHTRVLMLVHWGGYPIDLDEVAEIKTTYRKRYDQELYVIEDCAHAWGALYQGKPLPTYGNTTVHSFGAIKLLSCVDGGVVTFDNAHTTERAKLLRWYGLNREDRSIDSGEWGFKFHMNDLNASIGMANIPMSRHFLDQHRRNSAVYDRQLVDVPGIRLLERKPDRDSSCWLYTMLVERRPDFIKKLLSCGIESGPVHRRNDDYKCVDHHKKHLPRLDSLYENIVCIPVGWWLNGDDRNHIIETIRSGW